MVPYLRGQVEGLPLRAHDQLLHALRGQLAVPSGQRVELRDVAQVVLAVVIVDGPGSALFCIVHTFSTMFSIFYFLFHVFSFQFPVSTFQFPVSSFQFPISYFLFPIFNFHA